MGVLGAFIGAALVHCLITLIAGRPRPEVGALYGVATVVLVALFIAITIVEATGGER